LVNVSLIYAVKEVVQVELEKPLRATVTSGTLLDAAGRVKRE
jgi:hypothetical protein